MVSDGKLSQIGKQFGADYVCVINISILYDERFVSAKFLNTETAVVEVAADINGNWKDLSELIAVAKELAAKLVVGQQTDTNGPKQVRFNNLNYNVMPTDFETTLTWKKAKSVCEELIAFDKSDWYLPNKAELYGLYQHKEEIGGFTQNGYWSSTESSSKFGYMQNFSSGDQYTSSKKNHRMVRCIRKD